MEGSIEVCIAVPSGPVIDELSVILELLPNSSATGEQKKNLLSFPKTFYVHYFSKRRLLDRRKDSSYKCSFRVHHRLCHNQHSQLSSCRTC